MLAGLVRQVASLGAPASANALGFESCLRNAGNYLMRVSKEGAHFDRSSDRRPAPYQIFGAPQLW
eukprot:8762700-Pyramimonas_sp.AAC.2